MRVYLSADYGTVKANASTTFIAESMRTYLTAVTGKTLDRCTSLGQIGEAMRAYLSPLEGRISDKSIPLGKMVDALKAYLVAWPVEKEHKGVSLDAIGEHMRMYLSSQQPEKQADASLDHIQDAMRFYLATSDTTSDSNHSMKTIAESVVIRPLRLLLSYYYFQKSPLEEHLQEIFGDYPVDIFVDSGGYSAETLGVPVNIDEYAKFILKYQHLITTYANLDIIQSERKTWENQKYLEDNYGLKPLPVFHASEEWRYFDRYVEQYPYIALGFRGFNRNTCIPWILECFKRAQGKSVLHSFGVTNWKVLTSFPWYSTDSSSWGSGFKYAQFDLFDPQAGRFRGVRRHHADCYKYADLIRWYGFEPEDFYYFERIDRRKICAISILSYMQAEHYLQQRWGEVQIPIREPV